MPTIPVVSVQIEARFWRKVAISSADACWPWRGSINNEGYGRMRISGQLYAAHRLAFSIATGAIPKGLCICHSCDVPKCCNPSHLFAGTQIQNMRDRDTKARTPRTKGEAHGSHKLTDSLVRELRALYSAGIKPRALANRFGVNHATIWRAVTRRSWGHLT